MMMVRSSVLLAMLLAGCGWTEVSTDDRGSESESESTASETSAETSGTSDDGTSTEDGSDPLECGGFELVSVSVPTHVMFVVDVSSSMLDGWSQARSLINEIVAYIDDLASLGLQRAPSSDADMCLVDSTPEVEIGEHHGGQVLAALPDASASELEILGGSPIGAAYSVARDHLLAQPERAFPVIVLITDGGANCVEPSLPEAAEVFDAGLEGMVAEAHDVYGIATIVIGVDVVEGQPNVPAQPDSPAVDAFAALNAIAVAGGSPFWGNEPRKFYEASFDELQPVFEGTCSVTDCTVDLTMTPDGPPAPDQIPLIEIEIDGAEVPYVSDCANEDGWSWIVEGEYMTFCGIQCEKFKLGSTIVGTYGCPPSN